MFDWLKEKEEPLKNEPGWKIVGYAILNEQNEIYCCNGLFVASMYFLKAIQIFNDKSDAEKLSEELTKNGYGKTRIVAIKKKIG